MASRHHALDHRPLRLGNGGGVRRRAPARPSSAARRAFTTLPPRRVGRRIGEQRFVVANRVRLLAVLLGGEREIEARLRLAGLFGERPIERLARLVGDDAARGGDQSLAVSGAAQGVFAEKAQRLGIGVGGVGIALEAHVDRRDHRPALAVVGLGDEPRFDRRDRRLDLAGRLRRDLAARQRLVGQRGPAEARIKGKGDRRQPDGDQRGRRETRAPRRPAAPARARTPRR